MHTASTGLLLQAQLALIKKNQEKLLIAHERSKTITRSAEMKEIRERMQVLALATHLVQMGAACSAHHPIRFCTHLATPVHLQIPAWFPCDVTSDLCFWWFFQAGDTKGVAIFAGRHR